MRRLDVWAEDPVVDENEPPTGKLTGDKEV